MDVLTLTYDEVERLLTPQMCVEALEEAYREQARGLTVNRARSHSYIPLDGEPDDPTRHYYYLKTMEGGIKKSGYMALRINSGVSSYGSVAGLARRTYTPTILDGNGQARWFEILMLFDTARGDLLAIMPAGHIQRLRVGSTTALGTKYLARPDAHRIGLFGSGWQASGQLLAHVHVRAITEVKVYSITPENRQRFARQMQAQLGVPVRAVETPREAVEDVDIVISATNSFVPVLKAEWLRPGQHLTYICHGEMGQDAVDRCDRVVVHSHLGAQNVWTDEPNLPTHQWAEKLVDDVQKYPQLCDLVSGKVPGRLSDQELTCFITTQGLGQQFAAAAGKVYEEARRQGVGARECWDRFLQDVHP